LALLPYSVDDGQSAEMAFANRFTHTKFEPEVFLEQNPIFYQ